MVWRRVIRAGLLIGSIGATAVVAEQPSLAEAGSSEPGPAPAAAQNSTPPARHPIAELQWSSLTADATLPVALEPGAAVAEDGLWVPQRQTNTLVRVDPRTNAVDRTVTLEAPPCGSIAVAFDSVWVPSCEAKTLARIDANSGNAAASSPLPIATPDGTVAVAAGSLWVATSARGVVSRIDPATNGPVAEIYVAASPVGIAAGDDSIWVTSAEGDVLTQIDAHTNVVLGTVKVGPRPGRVVVGEGAVWTLNRGDGSVTRVDPKAGTVEATIAVGAWSAEGEIAAGEGSIWLSAPGVPITRIDPRTNRAVQRFTGTGGGAVVVGHGSVWVAAGPKSTWRLDPKLVAALRP